MGGGCEDASPRVSTCENVSTRGRLLASCCTLNSVVTSHDERWSLAAHRSSQVDDKERWTPPDAGSDEVGWKFGFKGGLKMGGGFGTTPLV